MHFAADQLASDSQLTPVELSQDRAVIEIRRAIDISRWLLVFAVIWNLMVIVVGTTLLTHAHEFDFVVFLAFAILLAFGVTVLRTALRLHFTETTVVLERRRLVICSTLFGRKKRPASTCSTLKVGLAGRQR